MLTVKGSKVPSRSVMIPAVSHGRKSCGRCGKSRDCYTNGFMVQALNLTVPVCAECLNYQYMVFRAVAVEEVLQKHRVSRHAFDGASVTSKNGVVTVGYPKPRLAEPDERVGLSCFVWVDGCCIASENCLDIHNGVERELRGIPGVQSVRVVLD